MRIRQTLDIIDRILEARAGIEPAYKDLQSVAFSEEEWRISAGICVFMGRKSRNVCDTLGQIFVQESAQS